MRLASALRPPPPEGPRQWSWVITASGECWGHPQTAHNPSAVSGTSRDELARAVGRHGHDVLDHEEVIAGMVRGKRLNSPASDSALPAVGTVTSMPRMKVCCPSRSEVPADSLHGDWLHVASMIRSVGASDIDGDGAQAATAAVWAAPAEPSIDRATSTRQETRDRFAIERILHPHRLGRPQTPARDDCTSIGCASVAFTCPTR